MRLVPRPGGTPQEFRALLISQPFDLAWAGPIIPSAGTPEACFSARFRGIVFVAAARGEIFTAARRGEIWIGRDHR
jgi:hypothetical protein